MYWQRIKFTLTREEFSVYLCPLSSEWGSGGISLNHITNYANYNSPIEKEEEGGREGEGVRSLIVCGHSYSCTIVGWYGKSSLLTKNLWLQRHTYAHSYIATPVQYM